LQLKKKYFVTGATGVIGNALIPLLLEDQDCQVWTLIRADSPGHLEARMEELIVFWNMGSEWEKKARSRIIPLLGDTDKSKFALSDAVYAEITRQCTHIIHCAGTVRMNLPLEVARQHAIGSAQNIVELALACQKSGFLQKIEYVSTVGVAGRMSGILPETWVSQPRDFHNTYEQAKAETEDCLREQIEQHNLPVTVHRPSMVVGNTQDGNVLYFQVFYYLCEFIAGRRTFGILPRFDNAAFDIVPIDYVVKVIKWSSEQGRSTVGKIFHLCSGPNSSICLMELQKIVRTMMKNHGIKLPFIFLVPLVFYTPILILITRLVPQKKWRYLRTLPIFVDYLKDLPLFENKNTIAFLKEKSGPELPPIENYLEKVFSTYLNAKSFK
jgi:thioester reductase-like protein